MRKNKRGGKMKFITFIENAEEKIGIITKDNERVVDINKVLGEEFYDMTEFIWNNEEYMEKLIDIYEKNENSHYKLEDVLVISPVPRPATDILCVGLNYSDHVKESQSVQDPDKKIEVPVFFTKRVLKAIGDGEIIQKHEGITEEIDYEAELGVVMGKEGISIKEEDAEEYIFGYTIVNDISARDLQRKHNQWFKGKGLDTHTSIGPCIVYKKYIENPENLNISSRVNGETRQNSNTKNLIFNIPFLIEELSKGMTLIPGDIVATGTPAGVGMGFKPPKYLKSGDIVECEIEKIGILKNIME